MSWFVYILRCEDGRFYTGVTSNLGRRLTEHRQGIGGRFTKGNRPSELVYREQYSNEHKAHQRESQIKAWSRAKKQALIAGDLVALKQA